MTLKKQNRIPPFPYHPFRRLGESDLTHNPVFWTLFMVILTIVIASVLYAMVLGATE